MEQFFQQAGTIEERLKYAFSDKNLLALGFIHRSFVNEHRDLVSDHNERLEFLGDSVLGLLVSEFLYRNFPDIPEGELSTLRSKLVQAGSCAAFVEKLDVTRYLLLGKGEQRSGGRGRESIHADLFEAIIGAIFLDGGLAKAEQFFFDNFARDIDELLSNPERNWKADLQDYSQRHYQEPPTYIVVSEEGPDHSKQFAIEVSIGGQVLGSGTGASKKQAQQAAARGALSEIEKKSEPV